MSLKQIKHKQKGSAADGDCHLLQPPPARGPPPPPPPTSKPVLIKQELIMDWIKHEIYN